MVDTVPLSKKTLACEQTPKVRHWEKRTETKAMEWSESSTVWGASSIFFFSSYTPLGSLFTGQEDLNSFKRTDANPLLFKNPKVHV